VNLLYTLGLDDEQQHRSAVLLIAGTSCARDARSSTEAGVSPACRIGTIVFVERIRGSHSGGPRSRRAIMTQYFLTLPHDSAEEPTMESMDPAALQEVFRG
jgi:hypothetical protein